MCEISIYFRLQYKTFKMSFITIASVFFIDLINAESDLEECTQPRAPSQRGSCDLPAVKPLSLAYCWAKYMAVFWHLS